MLLGDDVARLWREIGMPIAAPFAAREVVVFHDLALRGTGMVPALIVARFPPMVRDDDHLDARRAHGRYDGSYENIAKRMTDYVTANKEQLTLALGGSGGGVATQP